MISSHRACIIMIGFLLWVAVNPIVFSQPLSVKIDALIEQQLPHATVGVFVKDAQTGEVIYSRNANKLLSPASGTKLFTAAAALYHLKPTYQFLTTLSQKNQNFYISFGGSPSLTINNLNELVLSLKKKGVKIINGDIILDISRYKSPYYSGGVSYDDLGWYYSAPDTAVILNENAESYEFISAKKFGMPVQIKPKSTEAALTIINQVITVSKEQEKQHCNLNIETNSHNTVRVFGCMAQTIQPKVMQLAVPDPVFLANQVIQKALDKNGILLKGQIISGHVPSDVKVIAGVQSKPLAKLITHMLKESDNLYANSLTKQLGYSLTGEGTYKQGAYAIKKTLAQQTHLDMTQTELKDGPGTRYNLVTPEQVVVLLTDLLNDKNMQPIFFASLPQAGVSGTLRDRMKKTNLETRVFAKTGSMHDISSLSGYIVRENSRPLIFSIIINGINKPINIAKSLEEKILLVINDAKIQQGNELLY
jgi:D-alanyl-D-alanine carboxypeptidase/D-alanyl-D-alanine-endopeptidase (penicillin-binding protein 4)